MLVIAEWIEFGRISVTFTKMGLTAMADTIFDLETKNTGGKLNANRISPALV